MSSGAVKRVVKKELADILLELNEEIREFVNKEVQSRAEIAAPKVLTEETLDNLNKLENRIGILEGRMKDSRPEQDLFGGNPNKGEGCDKDVEINMSTIECELALMKPRLGEKTNSWLH